MLGKYSGENMNKLFKLLFFRYDINDVEYMPTLLLSLSSWLFIVIVISLFFI